jgi:serine/threonine protein phosphatase PrpC
VPWARTVRDLTLEKPSNSLAAIPRDACCPCACAVDLRRRHITVGNLGDSRAVVGVIADGYVTAAPLSEDHSASTDSEKFRLRTEHPMDPDIVVEQFDEWKEDYDCVVKSVTRFTRSASPVIQYVVTSTWIAGTDSHSRVRRISRRYW